MATREVEVHGPTWEDPEGRARTIEGIERDGRKIIGVRQCPAKGKVFLTTDGDD